VTYWFEHGGDPTRLTVSSDAGASSPGQLMDEWRDCVLRHRLPLERMLPLVTSNTATVLKLGGKGRIAAGCDGDVLVLRRDTLDVVHVFARGRHLVDDGRLTKREHFLESSRRRIHLNGQKQ
jgi:beta-aspartyl-dipeptidase (metallo-type)